MLTDGRIQEQAYLYITGWDGDIRPFARAIEDEVRAEAQEPNCVSLRIAIDELLLSWSAHPRDNSAETRKRRIAARTNLEALYTAPQPPAPCPKCAEFERISNHRMKLCDEWAGVSRKQDLEIISLEESVAELEQFKQMWAISCAERDALQTKVAEIEESARKSALNVGNWHRQFMKTMETVAEQYTLIEQCEQALEHPEYTSQGLARRRAEALAAIATHKKGIAK